MAVLGAVRVRGGHSIFRAWKGHLSSPSHSPNAGTQCVSAERPFASRVLGRHGAGGPQESLLGSPARSQHPQRIRPHRLSHGTRAPRFLFAFLSSGIRMSVLVVRWSWAL